MLFVHFLKNQYRGHILSLEVRNNKFFKKIKIHLEIPAFIELQKKSYWDIQETGRQKVDTYFVTLRGGKNIILLSATSTVLFCYCLTWQKVWEQGVSVGETNGCRQI